MATADEQIQKMKAFIEGGAEGNELSEGLTNQLMGYGCGRDTIASAAAFFFPSFAPAAAGVLVAFASFDVEFADSYGGEGDSIIDLTVRPRSSTWLALGELVGLTSPHSRLWNFKRGWRPPCCSS